MRRFSSLLLLVGLAACAGPGGYGQVPGAATLVEIERQIGAPALRWAEPDGGETLVYPTGPMGYHTWFLRTDASGKVLSRTNVLDERQFAKIQPGMREDEVAHLLGPPVAAWTTYFKARDELVYEWRYCNDWHEPARFNVMLDNTSRRVRSTYAASEDLRGIDRWAGRRGWCSR